MTNRLEEIRKSQGIKQEELAEALLVAAYLFVEGYAIFCRFKLEKEI